MNPQILGKMLMWAVLRLSETLASISWNAWPYQLQDARPHWTHQDRGQSIKRLGQKNEIPKRSPKSAPLSSTCCVHAASRSWTAGESTLTKLGFYTSRVTLRLLCNFHTCLPLPGPALFPISPCEGFCQCMGSEDRRSRSGLSLSLCSLSLVS